MLDEARAELPAPVERDTERLGLERRRGHALTVDGVEARHRIPEQDDPARHLPQPLHVPALARPHAMGDDLGQRLAAGDQLRNRRIGEAAREGEPAVVVRRGVVSVEPGQRHHPPWALEGECHAQPRGGGLAHDGADQPVGPTPGSRAQDPGGVSHVDADLRPGRRLEAERLQPAQGAGGASRGIDDELGGDLVAVLQPNAGDGPAAGGEDQSIRRTLAQRHRRK